MIERIGCFKVLTRHGSIVLKSAMNLEEKFSQGKRAQIIGIVTFLCLLIASGAESVITATLNDDNLSYSGPCPTDIEFKGAITSDKPGKVQYRIRSSDGSLLPVETLEFSGPGTKVINVHWPIDAPSLTSYEGWKTIQILYPQEIESNKAKLRVNCDQTVTDLTVRIKECPKTARPGHDLGTTFKIKAINRGMIDIKDVLLDIILKKELTCSISTPLAEYSPHFHDGVLLKGGRQQVSLNAGQTLMISPSGPNTIPADTQAGDYFLCAVIDAGNKIKESDKQNNCICCPLKIITSAGKPDLVVEAFHFKGWGKCEPNQPIFYFEVTVANIGSAASPALPDKAVVQVMDLPRNDWGNSAGLNSIPPGGRQTVEIPVYYFSKDPAHMTKAVPHPFRAIVDPLHLIDEPREKNKMSDIIYLDPSSICAKQ